MKANDTPFAASRGKARRRRGQTAEKAKPRPFERAPEAARSDPAHARPSFTLTPPPPLQEGWDWLGILGVAVVLAAGAAVVASRICAAPRVAI